MTDNGQDQQQLERVVTEKLSSFILSLMKEYFKLTEARIELEVCYGKDRKGKELFIEVSSHSSAGALIGDTLN